MNYVNYNMRLGRGTLLQTFSHFWILSHPVIKCPLMEVGFRKSAFFHSEVPVVKWWNDFLFCLSCKCSPGDSFEMSRRIFVKGRLLPVSQPLWADLLGSPCIISHTMGGLSILSQLHEATWAMCNLLKSLFNLAKTLQMGNCIFSCSFLTSSCL